MAKPAPYPLVQPMSRLGAMNAKDKTAARVAYRKVRQELLDSAQPGDSHSKRSASALSITDTASGRGKVKFVSGHSAHKHR